AEPFRQLVGPRELRRPVRTADTWNHPCLWRVELASERRPDLLPLPLGPAGARLPCPPRLGALGWRTRAWWANAWPRPSAVIRSPGRPRPARAGAGSVQQVERVGRVVHVVDAGPARSHRQAEQRARPRRAAGGVEGPLGDLQAGRRGLD